MVRSKALIALLAMLATAGCASQIMKGFVDQPIQTAIVKYGPPINAFDMGDGRRAFQWSMDRSYTAPVTATNYGTAAIYGTSAVWTQNTQISGGQTVSGRCIYTLYGRWSDSARAWMVSGFEKPPYACE